MSNATQWTPGPWRTNKDFEVEGYPFAVFTVPNGGEFTSVAVCAEYANARLIAAAPEMAELLEYIDTWVQENFDAMPIAWQTVAREIDALLAKIKGAAPHA